MPNLPTSQEVQTPVLPQHLLMSHPQPTAPMADLDNNYATTYIHHTDGLQSMYGEADGSDLLLNGLFDLGQISSPNQMTLPHQSTSPYQFISSDLTNPPYEPQFDTQATTFALAYPQQQNLDFDDGDIPQSTINCDGDDFLNSVPADIDAWIQQGCKG